MADEPRSCVICDRWVEGSDADRLKDDRWPACYQYRQRHGHDRPDPFDVLVDLLHRPGWMRDGACNEHPDLPWIGPTTAAQRRAMFDVCAGCLVRDECQAYTVDHVDLVGVWAGRVLDADALEVERERRRERARRYAAAVRRRPASPQKVLNSLGNDGKRRGPSGSESAGQAPNRG
jgi:hypothetical protein